MKKIVITAFLIICIIGMLSFQSNLQSNTVKQTVIDSLAAEREKFTNEILATISGKESEMANTVFRNIKTFKGKEGLKVNHFLGVMNYWGEALGISCTHCHNTNDWASDEKQAKKIARGMYTLRQIINKQISFKIETHKEIKPLVNCGTCHRGNKTPKEE